MNVNQMISEFAQDETNVKYITGYIILMIVSPITSVIFPKYVGKFIECMKTNESPDIKIMSLFAVISVTLHFWLEQLDAVFIPRLQSYIRIKIVTKILSDFRNNYKEQEVGMILNKIIRLPVVIRDIFTQLRQQIIPLIMTL